MTREQVLEAAVKAVSYAKKFTDYIEFSAEDASRSDPEFLIQVFREVIRAGAKTVNVPDTTGYAIPSEFGALMANLIERTAGAERVTWSAHCHNDRAAAANAAAVQYGARQIECTINGIGERAGNTSLEEVVMALRTRKNYLDLDTTVISEQLYPTSRLVSQVTGIPIPINKPIVGDNAFAHEAGIHRRRAKYKQIHEIMTLNPSAPATGWYGKFRRHAFDEHKTPGLNLSKEDMNRAFVRFKELADKKKNVYDEDIEAIVAEEFAPGRPDVRAVMRIRA
jgi:2-isopropylmalate synthase